MSAFTKGNYRPAIPKGMNPSANIGDRIPADVMQTVRSEHEARVKLKISDPSGFRPFIDQPMVDGTLPIDPKERTVALSKLVHEYRSANPNVIHAAGFITPDFSNSDDVSYLTSVFYQCQSVFTTMLNQVKEQEILPKSPKLESLAWEHIAFPRMANNLHILRACVLYFEQDEGALLVHVLFVYTHGEATVFSSRHPL